MCPLRVLFLAAAFFVFALAPRAAQAKFFFGDQQYVQHLADVKLKGANGEALFLGHMYKTTYFLAGLYVVDEGYVLGIKGNRERFYRMPDAAQVAYFQQEGLLPKPFPRYRLGWFDYLIGYSLWIALAILVPWGVIATMRRRRAMAVAAQWSRMSGAPTRLPGAAP